MMSFALTKLLSLLVYPLTQALLMGVLALVCHRWRKLALGLALLALGWLYACSTAWMADTLLGPLETAYPAGTLSALPQADAIVVLGGSTRGDAHLGSMADLNDRADRLTHAAALYQAGRAPKLLLSGGGAAEERPEARRMAQFMRLMNVPESALLYEDRSRDTHQNAVYSAVVLREQGAQKLLLVTSAFHMRRAVPLFEKQGFTVIPAATDYRRLVREPGIWLAVPTADNLLRTTYALREYVGYCYYRARGWL